MHFLVCQNQLLQILCVVKVCTIYQKLVANAYPEIRNFQYHISYIQYIVILEH